METAIRSSLDFLSTFKQLEKETELSMRACTVQKVSPSRRPRRAEVLPPILAPIRLLSSSGPSLAKNEEKEAIVHLEGHDYVLERDFFSPGSTLFCQATGTAALVKLCVKPVLSVRNPGLLCLQKSLVRQVDKERCLCRSQLCVYVPSHSCMLQKAIRGTPLHEHDERTPSFTCLVPIEVLVVGALFYT